MTSIRTLKQLGAELRRRRKSLGLTQDNISGQTGKRQATLSSLESVGHGTLETLFAVLSALNLELELRPRDKSNRKEIEDIF